MVPCPGSSQILVFHPVLVQRCFLRLHGRPARAPAPAPAAGFAIANLRPALANVQTAISGLSIARWKAPAATRSAAQQDVASMQRDLNATLPGLITQAEAESPAALSPAFAVFRNLDALYDVLLRVTETAALAGPASDASSLEDARAGLEDGRAKLGAWLLQSISAQDAQIVHLQASAPSPAGSAASGAHQNYGRRRPRQPQTTQEETGSHPGTTVISFSRGACPSGGV